MKFFKKIDIAKENKKLGNEYMPSGTIRVLNPYDLQKTVVKFGDHENSIEEIFKKVDSYKRKTEEFHDGDVGNSGETNGKTEIGHTREEDPSAQDDQSEEDVAKEDDLKSTHSDSTKLTAF